MTYFIIIYQTCERQQKSWCTSGIDVLGDIFAWWQSLGSSKFFGLWFTRPPKRHISPETLLPRLFLRQTEIYLIVSHTTRPASTMCVIMLIRWVLVFTLCPFSLCNFPQVSWTWLSVWLTVGRVATFSSADMSCSLALAWRQQAPGPASCPPWRARLGAQPGNRGWEAGVGQRGGSGGWGKEKGARFKGYFLSGFPLFSFSPHYQDVWCQTSSLIQPRREMRYKVQTKKTESGSWSFWDERKMPEVCFWSSGSCTRRS